MSSEEMGYIKAKLEDISEALEYIREGKMAICQLHADKLQRVESLVELSVTGDDKKVAGLSVGKWKLIGTPAIIVSVFIGIAVLQYVHTLNVAASMKEEAVAEAASVAKTEVKRETRAIDRDEAAAIVRDELAAAVAKYMKERGGK